MVVFKTQVTKTHPKLANRFLFAALHNRGCAFLFGLTWLDSVNICHLFATITMSSAKRVTHGSDSEDDPDFIPQDDAGKFIISVCFYSLNITRRFGVFWRRTDEWYQGGAPADGRRADGKEEVSFVFLLTIFSISFIRAREALWIDFQAAVSTPQRPEVVESPPKMVKIEKRYVFAGKEIMLVSTI